MTEADKVLAFAGCLKNPDGTSFALLPFQQDIIREVFEPTNADGTRTVRKAFLTCARQNGKSSLAAVVLLYLLYTAPPNNDVASCAGSRDQASILYKYCKALVLSTPELAKITSFTDSKKLIVNRRTGNSYRALSADGGLAHGFSFATVFVDELHIINGVRGEELLSAVFSSMGARKNSLIFITTTAGSRAAGSAWREYEYAQKVAQGLIKDPTYRAFLYVNDSAVALDDEAAWKRANPGLGYTKQLDYMQSQSARAIAAPAEAHRFKRLDLNCWGIGEESQWILPEDWAACEQAVDWDSFDTAYIGIDLSTNTDLTAVVLIFPKDGQFYVKPHFWMPTANIEQRSTNDGVPYGEWMRQGYITGVSGDCIDYEQIQDFILKQAERYSIKEVAFDRYGAARMTTQLANEGLLCVPISQTYSGVSEACKFVQRLILSKALVHDGHPVLKHHIDCVRIKQDATDRIMLKKPDRAKTVSRIDGVAAMVTGFSRALFEGTIKPLPQWSGNITVL